MQQQIAAGVWAGLTAGGTSATFGVQSPGTVFVSSIVTSVAGTSPSLQVFLDVMDVSGAWIQVAALTAQTGTGTQTATVTPPTVASNLTDNGRLRWTVSGTGANFGAALAVISA
ncbi:hypothetical protein ACIRVK_13655 [Streptomyces sp. NPDC101152]|uniref:hypothetical protein n=1 Tax=Streptomyces sp. NPDC101152 TaxID=3366116 RepID=UPI0037F12396